MHWLEKIYKDLDTKHKDSLEKFDITTEELVKTLFFKVREHIQSDKMPDVLLNYFGSFKAKIDRIYHNAVTLKNKLNTGSIDGEKRKIKIEELKIMIEAYNYKVENKHQWKTKRYNYKTVQLLELEDKLEIIECKQDNHLFGGQEIQT